MKKNNCENGYCFTNREKKQHPRKGFFWCGYCDQQLVASGKKCLICGKKACGKNFKKF